MRLLNILIAVVVSLVLLDLAVAGALGVMTRQGKLTPLVQFFEYGRSVPGKHRQWEDDPNAIGNLYDVAWLDTNLEESHERFALEDKQSGPVIRSYGMSFVDNILRQAQVIEGSLTLDRHSGPGAPPNYTFASFKQDHENRRAGDIVVLGILSSSVAGMASLSNQTWVFEQPAPFTYPIFKPSENGGLTQIEPIIRSAHQHRALTENLAEAAKWRNQQIEADQLWTREAFMFPAADRSPFLRLVRRSLATSAVQDRKDAVIAGSFPYAETLNRMITEFAEIARADDQRPIVFLIQTRDRRDPDLLAFSKEVLEDLNIPYVATADISPPEMQGAFLPDGHFKESVDAMFGQAFLDKISD